MRAAVKPTILFLGASPEDRARRTLDREIRAIASWLRATPASGALKLAQEWAVRISDLQRCLLEHRPAVVHFSGQGSEAGELLLLDEHDGAASVNPEALARLFEILGEGIRAVVLNACFSAPQARAIARHVPCVIGMDGALDEQAATAWSGAFYRALSYGRSIGTAFALACNEIDLHQLPGGKVPELIEQQGVQAAQVVLGAGVTNAAFVVPFLQNPGFVGRDDDLEKLHALLQKGEAVGVRPAALTGMGGIGKTQLAVEYAYRYRDAYPGGVYWVNAAQSWEAELAKLAEETGLREDDAPEAERLSRLARAFARLLKARSDALLVFDNVDDPRALRTDTLGFVPTTLGCRLLFTTRRKDLGSSFASVEVRILPPQAALELLLSTEGRREVLALGTEAERAEARAICCAFGYLPLALALAAAYLGQYADITLADYRGRLAREGVLATLDDHELDARDLATRHDAAVGATFRLQWDALKGDEPKRVLETAALLGEASEVPRARLALLTGLSDRAEGGYPARLGSALRKLGDLSLVEELTENAIRLHPLVREFADKRIMEREAFAAACSARLSEVLWDMGRLHQEVASRGIDAVLGDLRIGAALAAADGRERFSQMLRPLDREAHHLRGWDPAEQPGFFLQQLRNQGFEMGFEELQQRAEAKLEEQRWAYLYERIRTSRASAALVRTLEGHTDMVQCVAITPDGRLAVSASADGTLTVWDLNAGHALHTLQGHTGPVQSVAVTPDGRLAVSASDDRTLKVWDLNAGHALHTLHGHTDWVGSVAVTPDGRLAVSASHDRTLKVWDVSMGHSFATLRTHAPLQCCAATPDGKTLLAGDEAGALHILDLRHADPLPRR
jgi:hypothetical protein